MAYQSPIASDTSYGVVKVGTGIDVTDGVISVIPNGQVNTVLVEDADSPYAVSTTDFYIGVLGTTPSISIDLPVGVDGREVVVKQEFSNLSAVAITPASGEFVDGIGAGYTIPYLVGALSSITLIFRDDNWNIV